MKSYLKLMSIGAAFLMLSLTACHKEGCPGKITDIETQSELVQEC